MLKARLALCISLGILVSACSSSEPDPVVKSTLYTTNTKTGAKQSWSISCEYDDYSCNTKFITNARTMPMGDGVFYTCGLDSQLFVSRETHRAITNLEPLQNLECDFKVEVIKGN